MSAGLSQCKRSPDHGQNSLPVLQEAGLQRDLIPVQELKVRVPRLDIKWSRDYGVYFIRCDVIPLRQCPFCLSWLTWNQAGTHDWRGCDRD